MNGRTFFEQKKAQLAAHKFSAVEIERIYIDLAEVESFLRKLTYEYIVRNYCSEFDTVFENTYFDVSAWCWGKDPKTGLQAVELMSFFKPFDGYVNGIAFDVYNEYQYVTYGVLEVLRKIRKGLRETILKNV